MAAVECIELLTASECRKVHADVHRQRDHWTRRHRELPFFTLGTVGYLDAAADGAEAYRERAARTNPLLHEHFGWLEERLRATVEEAVGARCEHHEHLALPGFHVFGSHGSYGKAIASKHYDLQYQHIDWTGVGRPVPERQLSLTLSIKLPAGGAALRVWEISWDDVRVADLEERRRLIRTHPRPEVHRYAEGRLAIHSGHLLHQIAPYEDPRPDDERLTLQGHALPLDGGERWVLYW